MPEPKQPVSYIHGFSPEEQLRLENQGGYLEEKVHADVDLSERRELLEVGCGVGAQTETLLRRNPHLRVTAVDFSEAQLEVARKRVTDLRARFVQADALALPWSEPQFDAAFFCWVLEHVKDPGAVLREAARVLKPGAIIYCREVLNPVFWTSPEEPRLLDYWKRFNAFQAESGGDGEVGGKLGLLLKQAGFRSIETELVHWIEDARDIEARNTLCDYLREIFLSALPSLMNSQLGRADDRQTINSSFDRLKADPRSSVVFGYIAAKALK